MSKTATPETTPAKAEETFDFTEHESQMDNRTRLAYGLIRRVAIARGDKDLLPKGKKLTVTEVEAIIGREIGEAEGPRPCCV